MGLRVRRGCSFHGLSLNIDMDLEPFERINPCGYPGLEVTQLRDLGGPVDMKTVSEGLRCQMFERLGGCRTYPFEAKITGDESN